MDPHTRVNLRTYPTRIEAELVAARLEDEGIEAWISADDAGGEYPNLQISEGVEVLVDPDDVERARAVLEDAAHVADAGDDALAALAEASEAPDLERRTGRRSTAAGFVAGLAIGVLIGLAVARPGPDRPRAIDDGGPSMPATDEMPVDDGGGGRPGAPEGVEPE